MNLEGALGLMTSKLQDMLGKELVVGCRLPGVVLKVEGIPSWQTDYSQWD